MYGLGSGLRHLPYDLGLTRTSLWDRSLTGHSLHLVTGAQQCLADTYELCTYCVPGLRLGTARGTKRRQPGSCLEGRSDPRGTRGPVSWKDEA